MRLNEIQKPKSLVDFSNIVKAECSDIVKAYIATGKFLYRGTTRHKAEVYVGNPPTERGSKDTPISINAKTDQLMLALGYKATRRNSIYVTSDLDTAHWYGPEIDAKGKVYIIYPKNGFHFTWSPKMRDFYERLNLLKSQARFKPRGVAASLLKMLMRRKVEKKDLLTFKNSFEYITTELIAAINSGNEIMINGAYYAINYKIGVNMTLEDK